MNSEPDTTFCEQVDQIVVSSVNVSELDEKSGCTVCGEQGGGY